MTRAEQHMKEVGEHGQHALQSYSGNHALRARVDELVEAFFRNHQVERTPLTERFITALSIDRATNSEVSEPTQPATQAA